MDITGYFGLNLLSAYLASLEGRESIYLNKDKIEKPVIDLSRPILEDLDYDQVLLDLLKQMRARITHKKNYHSLWCFMTVHYRRCQPSNLLNEVHYWRLIESVWSSWRSSVAGFKWNQWQTSAEYVVYHDQKIDHLVSQVQDPLYERLQELHALL